ncbi:hypothetical protein [Salipiger abyssi]|nr:hypothetical protein [Salipiger abyssi]
MLDRRGFFKSASAALAATATPALAFQAPITETPDHPDWWKRIVEVIDHLEAADPHEMHLSIAAKAFAANEIRKALDMPQRNEKLVSEYRDATAIFIANGKRRESALTGGLV